MSINSIINWNNMLFYPHWFGLGAIPVQNRSVVAYKIVLRHLEVPQSKSALV
jgi:hypothetical protein